MKLSGLVRSTITKIRRLGRTEVPWGVRFGLFLTYVFLYLLWFSGYFGF